MMTLDGLKGLPQWVGYTDRKIPMCPHSGRAAATNNPETWGTASQAWAAKKRHGWAGIGYVFTIGAGVVGIDLDDCLTENGRLSDEARQIVQMLNSYTERSPSGRGLHILARGAIPHSVKTPRVEIYNELRYFTVTGRQYGPSEFATANIEERPDELNALFAVYGDHEPRPLAPPPRPPGERLDAGTNEADVARALACLPPQGDYNTDWLPILMAVYDAFPDERGIALIEAWSPGYPGEVARKWRSFETRPGQPITVATLFHRAKQFGYQQQRATRPPTPGRASSSGRHHADITDALAQRRRVNGHA